MTAAALAAVLLAACSSGPPPRLEATNAPADRPAQWHAPLPAEGQTAALTDWWQRFDDPLLPALIGAAQAVSPTVASAASRIAQARATRVAAGAALLPSLDASASAQRGRQDFTTGLANTASVGLRASWELDLFGGRRAARTAAEARLGGAEAGWHDALIALAAETATDYTSLRACEALVEQTRADSASRAETARLTGLSTRAGFESPANAALARASAAQGNNLLTQRRAQCDQQIKALVALTGIAEPALRERLQAGAARVPRPAPIAPAGVPAEALAQRPDLLAAERDLIAASAEVSQAEAARLPRIALAGSFSRSRFDAADFGTQTGTLWAIGPITVSLPLFDGGTRRADVSAAQARYDEAVLLYRGKLRNAVREVEEALVALQSTADRSADAQVATEGFAASFRATEARFKGGLASLFELEDARRSALGAETAATELQRERATAWISLYRALGGGWADAAAASQRSAATPFPSLATR